MTALNSVLVLHPALVECALPHQDGQLSQNSERENDETEQRRMFRTFQKQRGSGVAESHSKDASRNKVTRAGRSKSDDAFIGVTIWEMQPSESGTERRSFRLKKPDGQSIVLRPFRLGLNTQLVAGRSYVFSIESARTGFLYVIDREQHIGGKLGSPLLLFPTKGVRGGSSRITAGDLVEIPDQKNERAYFEAEKNGPDHVGELLTIIVSDKPLIEPSILRYEPIVLSSDEVDKWEQQWSTKTRWAENAGSAGRAYTEKEGRAGGDPNYKLKEGDPLPQRIYQVGSRIRGPLIVTLHFAYMEPAKSE